MDWKNWKDWRILSLLTLPLLALGGWLFYRRRGSRPVPRDKALVPMDLTPELAVPVTGLSVASAGAAEPERAARAPSSSLSTVQIYPAPARTRTGERHSGGSGGNGHTTNGGQKPERGHALENEPAKPLPLLVLVVPFLILAAAIVAVSFYKTPTYAQMTVPGGDANRGKQAIAQWGCGSCHTIPGIDNARGTVGPNLTGIGSRSFIAGHLDNTPDNLVNWIMHPQQIAPGNGMPDTGVPAPVARDMAAFLYSLR